ncbi:DUF4013 domain-containing protein [Halomicroarcula sp. F28]|uniref:DUF4013 domain-containing protein n=1 Tax=Haloarcula salinisoli TaxID=2487746 RepID=UPI001C738FCC|nr:DUF4013 domain-containing protein [Halomicroarcula salinisoli]MBX0287542.1 DUF4013 domain-containing protein [Halomicroarcula salinisoli]
MIEAALRYQTQGEDWLKRVAIGGGAMLLAFFVFIPIFTVYGYVLEVMRQVLRGDTDTPPEWGDYDIVQLSVNGAKGFAILFVYGLVIGAVTLLPTGVLLLLAAVLRSAILSAIGGVIGGVLYLVGAIAIAVVAPIMICNFLVKDDLSAGFDIDVLRTFVTNRTMLRAVGLAILVNFAVGIVSGVLGLTIIGAPVGFVVSFVGLSAVAYIWANGFADAYREIHGELPEIPDGPTKMGADADAGATATEADADTTPSTPDDTVDGGTEASDTDDDVSGPDPTDGNRWD